MQINKQDEKLLQELLKKYKQGIISGLYPGSNITFAPTGCRDKIISSTSSGIGGGIQSIQEGDNITIDNTDPLNPIVNASGEGSATIYYEKTFSELRTLITNGDLEKGAMYMLTDFQTVYDQMDFDNTGALKGTLTTKTGGVEQIWVLALAPNKIASQAYSATYPNDKIQYDWTYNTTLVNGSPAKGRISERIDENNNRTDYDHREIKFIRYDDGAGNFTVINDNGNASQEFLTFVQNFTGGVVKDNWLGDFYSIGAFFGQEYPNNVFNSATCVNNSLGGFSRNSTYSGSIISNKVNQLTNSLIRNGSTYTFYNDVHNSVINDIDHSFFYGEVDALILNGITKDFITYGILNVTLDADIHTTSFIGYVENCIFLGTLDDVKINSSVYNLTFDSNIKNVEIAGSILFKSFTTALYPFLFNTNYKKEILQASDGNNYIRYFDGLTDAITLII